MALSRKEKDQKIYLAGKIFTPATPIISKELFSGRNDQIIMIIDAINTPGQHPIIYGERGVGKTSLANVISDILASQGEHVISIRINCDNTDDFSSIWEKVLGEITSTTTLNKPGFVSNIHQETESFTNDILRDDKGKIIITPNLVRKKLSIIGEGRVLICILDEFDRIENDEAKQLISDTIKSLSDFSSPVTLFLVGVAESIGDLVSKHESIERSLVQVRMPRMSIQEVRDIITTGVSKLEMGIEDNEVVWALLLCYCPIFSLNLLCPPLRLSPLAFLPIRQRDLYLWGYRPLLPMPG